MNDHAVLSLLTEILREVFDDDRLVATPELSARDVKGWDSLGNVRLFIEIEQAFTVRFAATEVASLRNLGELADLLSRKLQRSAR